MELLTDLSLYWQQYPSAIIVLVFAICYVIYYNLFVVKVPHLACKDEKFRRFLLEHCPAVTEKFKPTIWCFESRAQTIIGSFIKSSPKITYDSELVIMPDGGQIILDWYENENKDCRILNVSLNS
ncbi:hypothetical protein KUTeg_000120 [Tegillarca granosa]|uniref:ATP synthase F0 subunit 8 n=1 Tax=Tegillarca granosa TaxID=220873 RepID=A0ABQ9FWM5_TEGGR|nr:hypothetical protein KUTeg_000120 [Tegillarca granosa]